MKIDVEPEVRLTLQARHQNKIQTDLNTPSSMTEALCSLTNKPGQAGLIVFTVA